MSMFSFLEMEPVQAVLSILKFLPLACIGLYLLHNLIVAIRMHSSSDLFSIPEPPLPLWKLYTVGHDLLYYLFGTKCVESAEMFNEWKKRCGLIYQVRAMFGERTVMVFSESAIRYVNITKPGSFTKPRVVRSFLAPLTGQNGIILLDGERHSRLRKAVAPAMHHDTLLKVEHTFLDRGKALAEEFANCGSRGSDMNLEVSNATFDVIFKTCFGRKAASEELIAKMRDAYVTVLAEPPRHHVRAGILRRLLWFVDPMMFAWRKDLKVFLRNTLFSLCADIMKRRDAGVDDVDMPLLSLMIDHESKDSITKQEMLETVQTFVVAGQITTSMAVVWTFYLIAREYEWQQRLVKELETWNERDGLDALDRLPILDRIVKESIRLYPPACFTTRETSEPVTIDGYRIPKGVIVRMPIMAIQRSEEIWGPDVHDFNPDRFLDEKENAKRRFYWCAFQFGVRGCIGQRFALLETKAFIAQVLKGLRLYIKPLEDPAPIAYGCFSKAENMKVYFEKRVER